MSGFQPEADSLRNILELLEKSKHEPTGSQSEVQQFLNKFNSVPEFNCYLMYITANLSVAMLAELGLEEGRTEHQNTESVETSRALSAIMLKNNVLKSYNTFSNYIPEIIEQSLRCIGDRSRIIRTVVGSLITAIITVNPSMSVTYFPALNQLLGSQCEFQVEGAITALAIVCEDVSVKLLLGNPTQEECLLYQNITQMTPQFLRLCAHQRAKVRAYALECLIHFISGKDMPQALVSNLGVFVQTLFALAVDDDFNVRLNVCKAFVKCVGTLIEVLPSMNDILEYMLARTQDDSPEVALEAGEFWLALADIPAERLHPMIIPFLPRLLPVLINGMRYSEEDKDMLKADEEDYLTPDSINEVRPKFAKPRQHSSHMSQNDFAAAQEEEGYESDDDFADDLSKWNIRKCSAAALDMLSLSLNHHILQHLLPILEAELQHPDWDHKESGILALGAISDGCTDSLQGYLENVIPYLLTFLKHEKALVRSITCWTLSRYASWIVMQEEHLEQLLGDLLTCVLDNNKNVQECACSAFATLEEEALTCLVPYLKPIIEHLVAAFNKYQRRNLLILYDAIGTLADCVNSYLNQPEYIHMLLPPLMKKWNEFKEDDTDLLSFSECLTSVITALCEGFLPYAENVYIRCVQMIERTMISQERHKENSEVNTIHTDFAVVGLDILNGLLEGLGPAMESLVAGSNLIQLLNVCLNDKTPELLHTSFALIGELAKSCYPHLAPALPTFLPMIAESLNPLKIGVCNNACWALGEIAIQLSAYNNEKLIEPIAQTAVEKLVNIIVHYRMAPSLKENVALTLGCLGLVCPYMVGQYLPQFLSHWCDAVALSQEGQQKEASFKGVCQMISANPNGVGNDFKYFCVAIASWQKPAPDLMHCFHQLLTGWKNHNQANWNQFFGEFSPEIQTRLKQYNI